MTRRSLPTIGSCPSTEESIAPDADLVAGGFERRNLTDAKRAEEARELYESLGYEVELRKPTEKDFPPGCDDCASQCDQYLFVYTRRSKRPDE